MNEIIKKNGINYGLLIGGIAVLFQLCIYITGLPLYKNALLGVLIGLCYWIIRIVQANKIRSQFNNEITFKEVFTALLVSVTTGIFISVIFNFTFYNFIATELKPEVNNFMNSSQVPLYKMLKKSSNEINELIKTDNFSFMNLFKGALFSILISSIFNLILSAIFKTKSSNQL